MKVWKCDCGCGRVITTANECLGQSWVVTGDDGIVEERHVGCLWSIVPDFPSPSEYKDVTGLATVGYSLQPVSATSSVQPPSGVGPRTWTCRSCKSLARHVDSSARRCVTCAGAMVLIASLEASDAPFIGATAAPSALSTGLNHNSVRCSCGFKFAIPANSTSECCPACGNFVFWMPAFDPNPPSPTFPIPPMPVAPPPSVMVRWACACGKSCQAEENPVCATCGVLMDVAGEDEPELTERGVWKQKLEALRRHS